MRLHRFYIRQAIEDKHILIEDDELVHQWRNVFRYLVGAQVVVFNGDGYDYLCLVTELRNRSAELEITSRKKSVIPAKSIGLAMSFVKKDNMEFIIQKATELGVSKIFPIISERSEKKSLNMKRAEKIAIEAAEQSGRGDMPKIFEPMELKVFFESPELQGFEKRVVFHPKEENFSPIVLQDESVIIAIGPEGGFSDTEMELFPHNGFKKYSLGSLVLRAETAAIAALSVITLA